MNDDSKPKNVKPNSSNAKCKQSFYFPSTMLSEIKEEAARQDRSMSWIMQRAWKVAKKDIQELPGEVKAHADLVLPGSINEHDDDE